MKFHNPYHFVPVKRGERREDISREALDNVSLPSSHAHLTHDRYVESAYSGRIVCRLTTEDPVFVGDTKCKEATETSPAVVKPYELGDLPAIPASTIRGLISTIAEAASNSAMRVLENEMYSYRKTIEKDADEKDKPFSAIGMIVEVNGQFCLRPLTLPVLERPRDKNFWELPDIYKGLYRWPNLKVYIGDENSIREPDYKYKTYNHADKKFYYLKLHPHDKNPRRWDEDKEDTLSRDSGRYPRGGRFLLGQRCLKEEEPLLEEEVPPQEFPRYTRGIIRALGIYDADGNERKDIPDNKHREIFIPYPEGVENWPTIEIPLEVIKKFHDLADQRTESKKENKPLQLPYEPVGTIRNKNPKDDKDRTFRLKDGDLVYFRPTGGSPNKVDEISLSSIWRGRVETIINDSLQATSSHRFFSRIDKELLPFNPDRETITLAEQLFGFVEEKEKKDKETKDDKESLALAGRLYPSPARLEGIRNSDDPDWEQGNKGKDHPYTCDRKKSDSWVTLKILSSPKPPSPAMYFKLANGKGDYIRKRDLDPAKHQPQGRKFYLHRWAGDEGKTWETLDPPGKNSEQKVKICPIKPRAVFYFHIDFENLSETELGLLLYALRPSKEFRHKIGMAKALGLGRSRIEPVGLFRIDRLNRYSAAGLSAPRYSEVWRASDANLYPWTDDTALPDRYSREISAAGRPLTKSPQEIHREFRDKMNEEIRHALELIGDPASVTAPVHTPLVATQDRRCEEETFKWFVANDLGSGRKRKIEAKKKFLKPITTQDAKIPTLEKHEWSDQ